MFYTEVNVIESHANASIFACCMGNVYFGFEINENNEKLLAFAIIKPPSEDQILHDGYDAIEELEKKLKLRDRSSESESTFYKSFPFKLKVGVPISLVVAFIRASETHHSCVASVYNNNRQEWVNVKTYVTKIHASMKEPCRSIIENLTPDADKALSASFDPWIKDDTGWIQPKQATFFYTEGAQRINAWAHLDKFFMRTGGDTEQNLSSGEVIERAFSPAFPSILRAKLIQDELESKEKK